MKKILCLAFALMLGVTLAAVSPAMAAGKKKTSEHGRFQVFFNSSDAKIVYLVDTKDGRIWQAAFDPKIKLRYWRPMPVEGLDYPLSSYTKEAIKVFFKKKRGLAQKRN